MLNTHYYSSLQEPTRPVSTVYVQPGQVVGGRATQAAGQHYYSELKDPPERPVRGRTPQFVNIVRFTIASVTMLIRWRMNPLDIVASVNVLSWHGLNFKSSARYSREKVENTRCKT